MDSFSGIVMEVVMVIVIVMVMIKHGRWGEGGYIVYERWMNHKFSSFYDLVTVVMSFSQASQRSSQPTIVSYPYFHVYYALVSIIM